MISIIGRFRGVAPRRDVMVGGAALALALLPPAPAWAGVEYVTSTSNCTTHIAGPGDALTVMAGPGMRFEVWGNSVDLTNPTTGFKFTGPAGMQASIVARHSGSDNAARGCGLIGSAVVQVSTSGTLTTNAAASVSFQMPLGDFSTLGMTIVAHPALSQATWTTSGTLQPSNLPCIVKTGSISLLNQDTKLVIQLPPGASQDQTTCTSNVISLRVRPASSQTVDVEPSFKYNVTGLPSFVTVSQSPSTATPFAVPLLSFTFSVSGIRALTTTSSSTITIANPIATNRTTTLALQVSPTPGQGFAQVATANPTSTTAGNPIDFTLKLSAPAKSGQIITWRMTQAACFKQAVAEAPYSATATFQFYQFPTSATSAIIRVLSVNNSGCTNKLAATTQIFEAWIGDARVDPQVTTVTSGPTYTRTNISLLAP
ncbi:MAG: hypothetical protein ACM3SX_14095 [Deltaproteobacteria bacterium]